MIQLIVATSALLRFCIVTHVYFVLLFQNEIFVKLIPCFIFQSKNLWKKKTTDSNKTLKIKVIFR